MAMHSIETVQGEKFAKFIYSDQTFKKYKQKSKDNKEKKYFHRKYSNLRPPKYQL